MPGLDGGGLARLQTCLADGRFKVAIIDPLYLCFPGGKAAGGASNLYVMGSLLRGAAAACLHAGATPVFVHHANKGASKGSTAGGGLDLDDLAQTGVGEAARQWLLLNRRGPYPPGTGVHRLRLNVGGSAGHSGLFDVDVDEGRLDGRFGGRRWGVTVRDAEDDEAGDDREGGPGGGGFGGRGTPPRRPSPTRGPGNKQPQFGLGASFRTGKG